MKKRILSMLLVVVMLVLALSGCAYKYEKDKMSKYVDFDRAKFQELLKALVVEDATFGRDENKRGAKVDDEILKALANLATGEVKDKVIGNNDVLNYCYYITAKDDNGAFVASGASMKESAKVSLQFGLSTTKDLSAKIEEALQGYDFKDNAYTTTSSSTKAAEGGQLVCVTYTKVVGDTTTTFTNDIRIVAMERTGALEGEGENAKKKPATLDEIILGQKATVKDETEYTVTEGETAVKYKNITVNWIATDYKDVTVEYKPTEKTSVSAAGRSSNVDLAGEKVTDVVYHIFPVSFKDVVDYKGEDYNATLILKDILGSNITVGQEEETDKKGNVTQAKVDPTLPIFGADTQYKLADGTSVYDAVKTLIELYTTFDNAKSDYDTKKSAFDDLDADYDETKDPTQEETDAYNNAKAAMDSAKTAMDNAEKDVDEQIKKIVEAKKADGATAEAAIKAQYFDYKYKALETSYKTSMKKNLVKAIYEAAVQCMTWKMDGDTPILPKKAVKQAYTAIMNSYEYDYYEGTTSQKDSETGSSVSVPNYTLYESLEAFLRTKLGLAEDASKDDIKATITAEAQAAVKDTVVVYLLKQEVEAIFDTDLKVTKDDINEFKNGITYILLQYYSGVSEVKDEYYKPALQLDKVMNFLVELEDGTVSATDKSVVLKNKDKIGYTYK